MKKFVGFLITVWPLAPAVLFGFWLHVPYLFSLGAKEFPDLSLTSGAMWSLCIYLVLVGVVALMGYVAHMLLRGLWRRVYVLLLILLVLGFATLTIGSWLVDRAWVHWSVYTWVVVSLLMGVFVRVGTTMRKSGEEQTETEQASIMMLVTNFSIFALLMTATFLYSLAILPNLPDVVGGLQKRAIVLRGPTHPGPIRMVTPNLSAPVWLIYREPNSIWIQTLSTSRDGQILVRLSLADAGHIESSASRPERPLLRTKAWTLRLPRVSTR